MSIIQKVAKAVRVITTPPIFATILCVLLYILYDGAFASIAHFCVTVFFLGVLPLLSYPVAAIIPSLRRKGRTAERNLALVFSMLGYLCGFAFVLLTDSTVYEKIMFCTYLISGVSLALFTILHFKASGHACGCSGPPALLSYLISPWFLLSYLLLIPIFWSSIKLKRHRAAELLVGIIIPVIAMFISMAIFY